MATNKSLFIRKFPKEKKDFLVAIAIFLAMAFFFCILRLRVAGFNLESGDTAVAEQALWNTIHGDLFRQSFLDNHNNLVEHLNFIQFVYLPFYWAVPSLYTLYLLINFSYGTACFFLYRYAKERIGFLSACFMVLFFLLNPIVVLTNIGAMHVVSVGAPLLLLTLIFYEKRKYGWWICFMLLTTATTEFIAPTIFMLGVLAFLEKRSWKWFLPPVLAGSIMYLASVLFIKIGFSKNDSILKSFQLSEIVKNNIRGRLSALEEFFRPALYLIPFLSKYSLLLLPTVVMTLFVVNKGRLSPGSHLFTLVPVILSFAIIDLIYRKPKFKKAILCVIAIGLVLSLSIYLEKVEDIKPVKRADDFGRAIALVKDGGSVTASRNLSYHLSHRSELYLVDNQKHTDYIVLNTSFWDSKPKNNSYLKSIFESDDYVKLMDENDTVVFAKKSKLDALIND